MPSEAPYLNPSAQPTSPHRSPHQQRPLGRLPVLRSARKTRRLKRIVPLRPAPSGSHAARSLGEGAGPLVFTREQGKALDDNQLRWLVRNRVEATHARSDLFDRRGVLMDDWARYLAQGSGEDGDPLE